MVPKCLAKGMAADISVQPVYGSRVLDNVVCAVSGNMAEVVAFMAEQVFGLIHKRVVLPQQLERFDAAFI